MIVSRGDRVRKNTPKHVNKKIREATDRRIAYYAGKTPAEISLRISQLDREWDIERVLELNASVLISFGLLKGLKKRLWLLLPGLVGVFLLQHAVQGWCPPIELFRRLGIRTRREIDREKYALKQLRGDFKKAENGKPRVVQVLRSLEA